MTTEQLYNRYQNLDIAMLAATIADIATSFDIDTMHDDTLALKVLVDILDKKINTDL